MSAFPGMSSPATIQSSASTTGPGRRFLHVEVALPKIVSLSLPASLPQFQSQSQSLSCLAPSPATFDLCTLFATLPACAAGQFEDEATVTATCKLCPAGLFQHEPGETSCDTCIAGKFLAQQGQDAPTDCEACSVGKFQADSGTSACKLCPGGYYQDQTATASCKFCPDDWFEDEAGQAACEACPGGRNSLGSGLVCSGTCTLCPPICRSFFDTPIVGCTLLLIRHFDSVHNPAPPVPQIALGCTAWSAPLLKFAPCATPPMAV